jgi:hypothetical protein
MSWLEPPIRLGCSALTALGIRGEGLSRLTVACSALLCPHWSLLRPAPRTTVVIPFPTSTRDAFVKVSAVGRVTVTTTETQAREQARTTTAHICTVTCANRQSRSVRCSPISGAARGIGRHLSASRAVSAASSTRPIPRQAGGNLSLQMYDASSEAGMVSGLRNQIDRDPRPAGVNYSSAVGSATSPNGSHSSASQARALSNAVANKQSNLDIMKQFQRRMV